MEEITVGELAEAVKSMKIDKRIWQNNSENGKVLDTNCYRIFMTNITPSMKWTIYTRSDVATM